MSPIQIHHLHEASEKRREDERVKEDQMFEKFSDNQRFPGFGSYFVALLCTVIKCFNNDFNWQFFNLFFVYTFLL